MNTYLVRVYLDESLTDEQCDALGVLLEGAGTGSWYISDEALEIEVDCETKDYSLLFVKVRLLWIKAKYNDALMTSEKVYDVF